MRHLLSAGFVLVAAIFVLTLGVFFFNTTSTRDVPVTNTRSLASAIANENAKESSRALYDAGNGYGFLVSPSMVSAVRYASSRYPCAFACGTYVPAGDSVNFPIASGDVLVAQYPNADGTYATLDLSTGTYNAATSPTDPAVVATASGTPLTDDDVRAMGYPTLSLQKESCLVITMAEILLLVVLGGGAAVAMIAEKRKKTASA